MVYNILVVFSLQVNYTTKKYCCLAFFRNCSLFSWLFFYNAHSTVKLIRIIIGDYQKISLVSEEYISFLSVPYTATTADTAVIKSIIRTAAAK